MASTLFNIYDLIDQPVDFNEPKHYIIRKENTFDDAASRGSSVGTAVPSVSFPMKKLHSKFSMMLDSEEHNEIKTYADVLQCIK